MDAALAITIGGLVQGSVFALVAIGFALVYRVTGTVNLAQGAFVVLGALATYSFEQTLGWPVALAALAALAVAAVVGFSSPSLVFAPGLRRLPPSGMVILTGGLLTLFEGAALLVWGSQPYQLPPFSGYQPVAIGGVHVPTQAFWDVGITAVVIIAVMWYVLQRTTFGKALRACAENPTAATLMGIDVERVRIFSYTAAAVLGALSGIAIGPIVSLQFDGGRFFTVYGFISVAIGGMGSFAGALLGGLGIGVLQQLGAAYVSSIFATTLAIGLLIVVLVWRPNGLFGRGARREDNRAAGCARDRGARADPSGDGAHRGRYGGRGDRVAARTGPRRRAELADDRGDHLRRRHGARRADGVRGTDQPRACGVRRDRRVRRGDRDGAVRPAAARGHRDRPRRLAARARRRRIAERRCDCAASTWRSRRWRSAY